MRNRPVAISGISESRVAPVAAHIQKKKMVMVLLLFLRRLERRDWLLTFLFFTMAVFM